MPSILAAHALTTLAAVNAELSLTADGGAVDNMIERFINGASERITKWCGREFIRTDSIEEKVKGKGTNVIRLSRRPILAIDSIVISDSTVDADDYFIEDADAGKVYRAAGWPNTAQRAPGISQPLVPGTEDASQIVVTYDGGYITPAQAATAGAWVTAGLFAGQARTLPWDIEDACIRLVASRWRKRGTDASIEQASGQNSSHSFQAEHMPRDVMAMLNPYRIFPHA